MRVSLHDDRLLSTVASQLGAAMQNANLFEAQTSYAAELEIRVAQRTLELQEERDRLDILNQISLELARILEFARTIDMRELLALTIKMLSKAIGAKDAVIILEDPATGNFYCHAWLNPANLNSETPDSNPTRPAEGLATWLIQNSEDGEHAVIINDLHEQDFWNVERDGPTGLRSALAVMLESNDDPMGVMVLLGDSVGGFMEQHLKLLVPAATQVSTALNSADLYHLINDQTDRLAMLLRMEQDQAEKQGAMLESVADGVIFADASGSIEIVNSAAERILQLDRQSMLTQSITQFMEEYGLSAAQWIDRINVWANSEEMVDTITDDITLSIYP